MNSLRVRLSASVLLVVVAALFFLSFQTAHRAQSMLEPELERKAASVAGSVASLVDKALGLGIPLDRLVGLDTHLEAVLESNPDLSFIALRGPDGATTYGASTGIDGQGTAASGGKVVNAPIEAGDGTVVLEVGLNPAYARQVVSTLWIDLAIVIFVTAVVTLELIYVGFGVGLYGAIEGVESRLRTIRKGDLRLHPPVDAESEFGRFARVLDQRLDGLHSAYAALRQRAVDGHNQITQQALDLMRNRFGLGEGMIAPPLQALAMRAPLFVFMLAEELTRPFLPVYIRSLATPIPGLSPEFVISLPMITFLAVVALSQPLLGNATEWIGRRRGLMIGSALGILGYCASALVEGLLALSLARAVTAVGFALVFTSAQGHVIDSTDLRQRSSGMAIFISAILVAGLCGPPIGGILADRIGIPATFIVAGLFSAISLGLAYVCMPASTKRSSARGPAIRWKDFGTIVSSPRLAALFFFAAMPAKITLVAFCFFLVPLQMGALGATQSMTGRMLMIYPIAMVLLVPVFASIADRSNMRVQFVALGGIVAGLSSFVLLAHGDAVLMIALMLVGLGLGQAISIAPLSGLVGEVARDLPAEIGESSVYGIFRLVERTGNALGPLVSGLLLGLYGFETTVMIIGAGMAVCALCFFIIVGMVRGTGELPAAGS